MGAIGASGQRRLLSARTPEAKAKAPLTIHNGRHPAGISAGPIIIMAAVPTGM